MKIIKAAFVNKRRDECLRAPRCAHKSESDICLAYAAARGGAIPNCICTYTPRRQTNATNITRAKPILIDSKCMRRRYSISLHSRTKHNIVFDENVEKFEFSRVNFDINNR